MEVRQCAIDWMAEIGSDELVDYLPQLLEALKHETWSVSPLAKLLLQRSLQSPRVAHSLYWLLTQVCSIPSFNCNFISLIATHIPIQSLPGPTPQNTTADYSSAAMSAESLVKLARYRRRLQSLMKALFLSSGEAMRNSLIKQQELLKVTIFFTLRRGWVAFFIFMTLHLSFSSSTSMKRHGMSKDPKRE